MRLIGLINGWTEAPECWRHFFVPPVRVRRESALILDAEGEPTIQEAPAAQELACTASGRRKGQTHIEKLMEDHVRLFGQNHAPDPLAPTPTAALIEGSVEHVH